MGPDDRPGSTPSVNVEALRRSYGAAGLVETDVPATPMALFDDWLVAAVGGGVLEPNAMVLSTVSAEGQPSSRTVLLKGADARGFTFFTNLHSRKGRELEANPRASLVFPWYDLERQVVVLGQVVPVKRAETEAYWDTRPYGSRIGAWASAQSTVVGGRDVLDQWWQQAQERYPEGGSVPLPDHWGGLRLEPSSVEFWQGRRDRMHDRLRYVRADTAAPWAVERLSP